MQCHLIQILTQIQCYRHSIFSKLMFECYLQSRQNILNKIIQRNVFTNKKSFNWKKFLYFFLRISIPYQMSECPIKQFESWYSFVFLWLHIRILCFQQIILVQPSFFLFYLFCNFCGIYGWIILDCMHSFYSIFIPKRWKIIIALEKTE